VYGIYIGISRIMPLDVDSSATFFEPLGLGELWVLYICLSMPLRLCTLAMSFICHNLVFELCRFLFWVVVDRLLSDASENESRCWTDLFNSVDHCWSFALRCCPISGTVVFSLPFESSLQAKKSRNYREAFAAVFLHHPPSPSSALKFPSGTRTLYTFYVP
jgi:hypothetical protein